MTIREMAEGLQILARYETRGLDADILALDVERIFASDADCDEADVVAAEKRTEELGDSGVLRDRRIEPGDQARLESYGWFVDPEEERWCHYL